MADTGYLQHETGPVGPFLTEAVRVRNEYADQWQAFYRGRWRRVHSQVSRMFIVYRGEKIAIQIWGV